MNPPTTPAPLVEFTLVPKGTLIKPEAALTIEQAFAPYALQFQELSATLSTITDPKEAKAARLKLRKVRTDTDKKHEEMKRESLNYGRALDTAKNLIHEQIQPLEEKMREIEEAEERRLAQIIADRRRQHLAALAPYLDPNVPAPFVDGITDDQFAAMLDNAKLLHQAKIERQQREERERLEREEQQRQEQERIRLENERLREQAAEQERLRLEQEERHRKEQAARDAEAKKLKDAADAKLKKEREAAQKKLDEERRQREAAEEQARIEREAREKEQRAAAEAERARKEDEARRQREAQEAAERAAAAPDKEKLQTYIAALKLIPAPTVKTKKAQALIELIEEAFLEFTSQADERIAKL